MQINAGLTVSPPHENLPHLEVSHVLLSLTKKLNLLTKVGEFQLSSVANEEVLGFQVTVKNVPLVDVGQTSQQLEQEELENNQKTGEQREVTLT